MTREWLTAPQDPHAQSGAQFVPVGDRGGIPPVHEPANESVAIRMVRFAVLATVLIFNSGYALTVTAVGAPWRIPALVLSIVVIVLLYRRRRLSRRSSVALAVFLTAVGLSSIANYGPSSLVNNVIPVAVVLLAYLIVSGVAFRDFCEFYIRVMLCLVVGALVVYVLVNVFGVTPRLPVIYNWNGVPLLNGGLFFLYQYSPGTAPSLGPFWEPGVFASAIAVAALLEISLVRRPTSRWTLIVFALGLLSTSSSAGVLLLLLLLALYMARRMRRLAALMALLGALLVVMVIAFPAHVADVTVHSSIPAIADAFDSSSLSTLTRLNGPLINLRVFRESPLFGVGFGNVGSRFAELARSSLAADSQTSTSTYLMAVFGILGVCYTVFWAISILRLEDLSYPERILTLVIFLLILNKEPHTTMLTTYCFLFYFLDSPGPRRVRLKSATVIGPMPDDRPQRFGSGE